MKAEINASFVSLYLYVPNEDSLLPKYRDCTTSDGLELYLMCSGVISSSTNNIYVYVYICKK